MATEQLTVRLLLDSTRYNTSARQAATATDQIGTSATKTGTATGKMDSQMTTFANTAKFAIAGAAAAGVASFVKSSVSGFISFDDAMNQSLAIMGDVSTTMRQDMADAAREIGQTTRIGAEEAAEAYFFLASAGLDAEQSIAALPQVAAFAQAGMFDMATATDLATDAQSALGLASDDAGQNLENLTRVTDVFVKANTLANTSVQQISEAMTNKAGAAMRSVGIDIEEGAAVLAAFADQGVKGAEAGTQFSIVLRDLQTRAIQNKDAFEKAGISVFDANGEFRNFADIIGELETRLAGMSDEQKKAELATLGFTDKSISALTTLLGTSDAIREYETELRKAGGTTQEVADKQLDSFQGKLDLLNGKINELKLAIGEGLIPVVMEFADVAGSVAGPMADLIGMINKVTTHTDESGESVSVLGRLIRSLPGGQLADFFEMFEDKSNDVKEAVDEVNVSVSDQKQHAAALAGELDALRNQTQRVIDPTEDLTRATSDAARVGREYTTAIRDQRLAKLELIDPVFGALRALSSYKEALAEATEVAEDNEATTQDQIDANLRVLETYGNLVGEAQNYAEVAGVSLEDALRTLGSQAGLTDDAVQDIIDSLRELDGITVSPRIQIKVGSTVVGVTDGGVTRRQHGGPVTARQVYMVGEAGPELFVPHQSGQILSNQVFNQTTHRAISGGNVHVTVQGFVGSELQLAEEIDRVLTRRERTSGLSF